MSVACLVEGFSDKSDIVGSTTTTAGLADDHCDFIGIISTGKNGFHNLAYYHERGVTSIIIYVFKAHIYGMFIVIRKYLQIISGCIKGRFQNIKVDWRHLWAKDGVILTHCLGEGYLFNGC